MVCLLLLTEFNDGEETCPFCGKKCNTQGRHTWRCKAKFAQEPLELVSIHGNNVDSTMVNIKTIDNSIVNINNQYELEAPEGISTEYGECLEHENNDSSHYV